MPEKEGFGPGPKKKEPEFNPWKKRLRRMKDNQDRHSKDWNKNRRLLFGESPESRKDAENAAQNEIAYGWGLIKALETSIYVHNPEVIIEARSKQLGPVAQLLEKVCTYDIDVGDVKSQGNLCLVDTFTCGYGVLMEVCRTEKSTVGIAGLEDEEDLGTDEAQVVREQEFGWERLQPEDLLVDPQATRLDLSDARYIAVALYPTITELRDTKAFTLPEDIENYPEASEDTRVNKGKSIAGESVNGRSVPEDDPDYKTVCLWEIWDRIQKKIVYCLDYHGDKIGEMDWPVRLKMGPRELFPMTVMAFHPAQRGWYPKPELSLIQPQLQEMNSCERMMRQDTITKWRKWVVLAGLLSKDQIAKINDTSIDQAVIEVSLEELNNLLGEQNMQQQFHNIDIRNLLQPMEDISLKRDLPVRKEMLERDITHIIGYGPGERGGLPKTRSAKEALMLYEKQNQKMQKRLDAINDFYRLVYAKHVMFLQQLMELDRYTKVVDEVQNLTQFIDYTKEGIQGEFFFDIIPGSSGPKNTEMQKQSVMQMAQTIMPVLQAEGNSVRKVIERLARVNGWKDVDELFKNEKNELKLLAALLVKFGTGEVPPEAVLEQASKVVMAGLSTPELQMVQQAVAAEGGGGAAPGRSNAPIRERGESTTSMQQNASI